VSCQLRTLIEGFEKSDLLVKDFPEGVDKGDLLIEDLVVGFDKDDLLDEDLVEGTSTKVSCQLRTWLRVLTKVVSKLTWLKAFLKVSCQLRT